MRQFFIASAIAVGLVALWAAILPLTAEPAPAQTVAISPTMSKALFLCRGPNGVDRTCAGALAKALVLDAADDGMTQASDRVCRVAPGMLASLEPRH